jgi:hypothetical protein
MAMIFIYLKIALMMNTFIYVYPKSVTYLTLLKKVLQCICNIKKSFSAEVGSLGKETFTLDSCLSYLLPSRQFRNSLCPVCYPPLFLMPIKITAILLFINEKYV